jgi:4a-hydroxytetrahydrobiopterin dehydratase
MKSPEYEPVDATEARAFLAALSHSWRVVDGHSIESEFSFPDFSSALAFTNRIGAVAEEQGHHPDIHLSWGKVRVKTWTHAIDGLSRHDLELAAKIDAL